MPLARSYEEQAVVCPLTKKPCPLANGHLTLPFLKERDHVVIWALKSFGWIIPSIIAVLVAGGFLIKPATQVSVDQVRDQFANYISTREREETTRSKSLEAILNRVDANISDIAVRLRDAELWQAEMRGILNSESSDAKASPAPAAPNPHPSRRSHKRPAVKQENGLKVF